MSKGEEPEIDFETAFEWLAFAEYSRLEGASRELVLEMEENLRANAVDRERVRFWIGSMESLSSSLQDDLAAAEVLIRCGRAAYRLEISREAERLLLNIPQRLAGKPHHRAAVWWMLGCVRWRLPEKQNRAVQDWQHSINEFAAFLSRRPRYPLPVEWYQKQLLKVNILLREAAAPALWYRQSVERMNHTLQRAIAARVESWREANSNEEQPEKQAAAEAPGNADREKASWRAMEAEDLLQLWNVFASIPAGRPGEMPPDSHQIGRVEIDRVLIDGQPYQIFSLRRMGRVVNLLNEIGGKRSFVLKVCGNSMNNSRPVKIEDGDYVLLRAQETADDGDIVAANIPHLHQDSHAEATLKRFRKRDNQIFLESESVEADAYQPPEFAPGRAGFSVRGVALAVFKPLPAAPEQPAATEE